MVIYISQIKLLNEKVASCQIVESNIKNGSIKLNNYNVYHEVNTSELSNEEESEKYKKMM